MYNYKIKYIRNADSEELGDEAVYKLIDDYFNCLYNNGQIIGGHDIFIKDDIFHVTFVMPEHDSLSEKYNSEYAKERLEKLVAALEFQLIFEGVNFDYSRNCACEKPSLYLLATDYFQNTSPLSCGDCDRPIPLYKVPHISGEKEHYCIINDWQDSYKSIYRLWINGNWDRFSYGQLSKHNSKLNKEGLQLSRELEKGLNIPVYCHIFIHREDEYSLVPKGMIRETPTACPKCGKEWTYCAQWNRSPELLRWLGKEKTINFKSKFALCKCDDCRLAMDNPAWVENKE